MDSAAELVRRARQCAELSTRALADRAQVPPSTITRVEAGKIDPTVGMLRRLLDAAGQELHVTTRRRTTKRIPVLAELTNAWVDSPHEHPDWTRLRSWLDYLMTHPNEVERSIVRRPAKSQSLVLDSLLAGIAEKLADDAGLARPRWAAQTPNLNQEWSAFGTPRMMAAWRAAAPPQLLKRGLIIDAPSLWRDSETIVA
jgi:transcriptional regulator with XRE-family HTH domain